MVGRPEAPNQPNYWVWGMPIQNNYRAGTVPTQELVDCFDVLSTGKNVLDYYQPYLDEQHLKPNFNLESGYALTPEKDDNGNVTGYRETAPFRDRDLRFEAVCIHNGSTVYVGDARSTVTTYSGGNCELRDNARNYTRTITTTNSVSGTAVPTNGRLTGHGYISVLPRLCSTMPRLPWRRVTCPQPCA